MLKMKGNQPTRYILAQADYNFDLYYNQNMFVTNRDYKTCVDNLKTWNEQRISTLTANIEAVEEADRKTFWTLFSCRDIIRYK